MTKKPLRTSENVDAIYVDGEYQDETKLLDLKPSDIQQHQFMVSLSTIENKRIEVFFNSFDQLAEFVKAYDIE